MFVSCVTQDNLQTAVLLLSLVKLRGAATAEHSGFSTGCLGSVVAILFLILVVRQQSDGCNDLSVGKERGEGGEVQGCCALVVASISEVKQNLKLVS